MVVAGRSVAWERRLAFYLLQDRSITAATAINVDIDSLELAATPLLDLGDIAYMEHIDARVGLNPGQRIDTRIRSQVGTPDRAGLPFVVVADGARIYVGAFISSIDAPYQYGSNVILEDIKPDAFEIIGPPGELSMLGADRRDDPRIERVLADSGKYLQ